ncbi:hypothetical protein PCK1_002003, partial [Pneumocystis canis]
NQRNLYLLIYLFIEAVVIKNPSVTEAIKEMIKRGQPYIGAFLLKEDIDTDIISDINQIYDVGVFSQITSVFPASNVGDENALTVVLYPHRRIKIINLIGPQINTDQENDSKDKSIDNKENFKNETPDPETYVTDQNAENNYFDKESINPSENNGNNYATSFLNAYDISLVNVENLIDESFDPKNNIIRAVTSEIVSVFKDIATFNPLFRDQIANFSMSQSAGNVFEEPAKLADFAAAVSAGEVTELQDILETLSIEARLQKSLLVLKKELMNAQLQSKISKDVESKIQKRQREYYLIEQMKGIKRELGLESDGKDKLVEKFKDKTSKLSMPENVKKTFDEELNKLIHLEPSASEFNVTRNYLDWLTQIPWGQQSVENYDINRAIKILDEDHYGLKDIKDRILEFIAVGKLRGSVEGKILCFVGPPGVGKTSIGKSIARALDRQFYRFSVGGLSDVAEIKGHRRTYVGAMPGKIIQSLKKVQTENPLILIDEVDKIGRGHQGDPASALLELLDPEQNSSFLDHYLDLPVDLSKVLFVCTANIIDTIPGPLLDRMEIIHISGYIADEKMAIAKNYLAPEAKELAGLKDINVNLTDNAIESLIKYYCRESGVRNLKKHINKVYRKSTLDIVKSLEETIERDSLAYEKTDQNKEKNKDSFTEPQKTNEKIWKPLKVPSSVSITIDSSNLKDYVGPPIFTTDRLYETAPPGVVMGLAWTSQGGAVLYVESILENAISTTSKPNFVCTGQLGNVMKESSTIAYSYSKSYISQNYPDNKFFEKARIHLHCPEGAVPKDGPSAGITMTTSILSLALNYPVSSSIAMTGEITLTGKILRIGGLREKVVAAKRSGVDTIIYPKANQADWDILPDNIKKGLTSVPVNWYCDVFKVVFKNINKLLKMNTQTDRSINSINEQDMDLKDWIIRVKKLQEDRDKEDEERNRRLEEEILAERRARHERRAQRELSLSPDKFNSVSLMGSRHSASSPIIPKEKLSFRSDLLKTASQKRVLMRNISKYLKNVSGISEQEYVTDDACIKTNDLSISKRVSLNNGTVKHSIMHSSQLSEDIHEDSYDISSFQSKKDSDGDSFLQFEDTSFVSSFLKVKESTEIDFDSPENKQTSLQNLSNTYSSLESINVPEKEKSHILLESNSLFHSSTSSKSSYSDTLISNKLLGSDLPSSISSNNNISLIMNDISKNQFKGNFVQSAIMKNNNCHKSLCELSRKGSTFSKKDSKISTKSPTKTSITQKTSNLNKEKDSSKVDMTLSVEKENILSKVNCKMNLEESYHDILESVKQSIENESPLNNRNILESSGDTSFNNSPLESLSLEFERSNISPISCHKFQNTYSKSKINSLNRSSTPNSLDRDSTSNSLSRENISSPTFSKEKLGSPDFSKIDSFKAGILNAKNNLRPSSRTSSPKNDPFKDGILSAKESLKSFSVSPRKKLDVLKERILMAKASLGKPESCNDKFTSEDPSPLRLKKPSHNTNDGPLSISAKKKAFSPKGNELDFFSDGRLNSCQNNMNLDKSIAVSQNHSPLSHLSTESFTNIEKNSSQLIHITKNRTKGPHKRIPMNLVETLNINAYPNLCSGQSSQNDDKIINMIHLNPSSNNVCLIKEISEFFNNGTEIVESFDKNYTQSDLNPKLLTISSKSSDNIDNGLFNEKSDIISTDILMEALTKTLNKEKSKHTRPSIQEI